MTNTLHLIERLRRTLPRPTNYALAKALGLSQTTIKNVLAGKHGLGPKPVIRLAELLQIDARDVLVLIEQDKARTPEDKEFWGRRSPRITASIALAAALALAGTSKVTSAIAGQINSLTLTRYTLCAVRRFLRSLQPTAV
jgi:plasmid maintenance system antidote protein VapI